MDLVDSNGELMAHFRRLRPSASAFAFPAWWAEQVRRLSRDYGPADWANLSKRRQHQLLCEHLEASVSAAA